MNNLELFQMVLIIVIGSISIGSYAGYRINSTKLKVLKDSHQALNDAYIALNDAYIAHLRDHNIEKKASLGQVKAAVAETLTYSSAEHTYKQSINTKLDELNNEIDMLRSVQDRMLVNIKLIETWKEFTQETIVKHQETLKYIHFASLQDPKQMNDREKFQAKQTEEKFWPQSILGFISVVGEENIKKAFKDYYDKNVKSGDDLKSFKKATDKIFGTEDKSV